MFTYLRAPLQLGLLDETFILVRQQMGLNLRDRIHGHRHHDQETFRRNRTEMRPAFARSGFPAADKHNGEV